MILECPNCQKRYLVDPRSIGAHGRTVRCANCKHEWHADLDPELFEQLVQQVRAEKAAADAAAADDSIEASAERRRASAKANVPAVVKAPPVPMGIKIAAGLMGFFFVIVAGIYLRPTVVKQVPALSAVYSAVGLYETEGVVLADVAYNKEPVGLKDRHRVSGYIVNTSREPRRLPSVSAQLFGKDGVLIKGQLLKKADILQPGAKQKFMQELDTSPDSVARVVVEMGNPLDLRLRSKD